MKGSAAAPSAITPSVRSRWACMFWLAILIGATMVLAVVFGRLDAGFRCHRQRADSPTTIYSSSLRSTARQPCGANEAHGPATVNAATFFCTANDMAAASEQVKENVNAQNRSHVILARLFAGLRLRRVEDYSVRPLVA